MENVRFTIFSMFFLASALVSFFVAYISWQKRRERAGRELSMLMMAAGIWAFFVVFETASTSLDGKIFWSKVAYIGALTTPLFYTFFVFRFVGKDNYLTKKAYLALSLVPVVMFVMVWTNEIHNLVWVGYAPISPMTNLTQYYHGIAFWIGNVAYNYLLLAISSLYLVKFIYTHLYTFKVQAIMVFSASMIPWIASLFYVTGNNIVPGFDLVPLSMILSGTLLSMAMFRAKFLDLVPVAREKLLESIKEGILVLDTNFRVQDINNSARLFLNINRKDITGMTLFEIGEVNIYLRDAVLNDLPKTTIELKGEGDSRFFLIEKEDIVNYPGSKLVIIKDKTNDVQRSIEMLNATEKAKESDRLKSSFLANLSHEIRTPLNIITGFVDILRSDDLLEEDKEHYLELLKKSSDRIITTLNDIIEISKIEAGQVSFRESQINLNEIVDYLYNLFNKDAADKGLSLLIYKGLEDKESLIMTDREKLITTMSHLVKNAIKYSDIGKVEVGYKIQDKRLLFYVKDTGVGIPKERQKIIFNRFVQAEQSINRPYEGAGLGLSIVKSYVRILGGTINVKSKPGEGSCFWFSIPYEPLLTGFQ
jgi:signal transduction histidine kinase